METSSAILNKIVRSESHSFFIFCIIFLGLSYIHYAVLKIIVNDNEHYIYEIKLYTWFIILAIGLFQSLNYWLLKNNKERSRLLNQKQVYLQHSFNAIKSQNVIEFLKDALINTVGLIKKDPNLAVVQIEKLTSILRYLLQSRDQRFVKLGAELQNAQEYCELAEIQLSNKVNLSLNITEDFNHTNIPPLVFQMVLDNQFKNFAGSEKKELNIEVYIENKKFVVVKTSLPPSFENNFKNQQFINNLKQRYQLYNKASGVSELSTANDYFVKFPLVIG